MLTFDKETFKEAYENKYKNLHGEEIEEGKNQQKYEALGSLIKDYVIRLWMKTNKKYNKTGEKQIYYFSMEFLLGRLLGDMLLNLGIMDVCREALAELNIKLEALEQYEQDQGLIFNSANASLHTSIIPKFNNISPSNLPNRNSIEK